MKGVSWLTLGVRWILGLMLACGGLAYLKRRPLVGARHTGLLEAARRLGLALRAASARPGPLCSRRVPGQRLRERRRRAQRSVRGRL